MRRASEAKWSMGVSARRASTYPPNPASTTTTGRTQHEHDQDFRQLGPEPCFRTRHPQDDRASAYEGCAGKRPPRTTIRDDRFVPFLSAVIAASATGGREADAPDRYTCSPPANQTSLPRSSSSFRIVTTVAGPCNSATVGGCEKPFRCFEVVVQLIVELLEEFMANRDECRSRVHHQHQREGRGAYQAVRRTRMDAVDHHGVMARLPARRTRRRGPCE